jgi:polysaccharide export outer membrane protein
VRIIFFVGIFLLSSCASYKQNIMFKSTDTAVAERVRKEALGTEKNFQITKNDRLKIAVFSNAGERLIDPNPELTQTNSAARQSSQDEPIYLIDLLGLVKLPLVGEINLEGFTLKQAEEVLQKEYARFFKDPFVQLSFVNKRVIVLGALGGQVIPLENENTTVVEVLALAKGLNNDSKAQNMRLIRGDKVYEIDFSTIEGFKNGNMLIQSGDVVYVEPIRKPFSEGLRDYSGAISMLVSLATLITVISSLN